MCLYYLDSRYPLQSGRLREGVAYTNRQPWLAAARKLREAELSRLLSFLVRTNGHSLEVRICVRDLNVGFQFDQPGTFSSGRSARRVPFQPESGVQIDENRRSDGVAP